MATIVPLASTSPVRQGDSKRGILSREYPTVNADLGMAWIHLFGRYPLEDGMVFVNDISTIVVFIKRGRGKIATRDGVKDFRENDIVEIPVCQEYYWLANGFIELIVASAPAWNLTQNRMIPKNW